MADIITSALQTLQLFNLLADDYRPRTLAEVEALVALNQHTWSRSSIHRMLNTLAAANMLRQSTTGEWSIHPHVTAIAVNYQQSIIRRSEAIIAEVAEIHKTTSERIAE